MSKERYVKKSAKKLFNKENILTVPNLLTLFRLLLVPVIIYIYVAKKDYVLAAIVILISALTDILDGIIARKFNMVSDLGKIIDPLADKLTQVSIILCLTSRYSIMMVLLILFVIKEVLQAFCGYLVFSRKGSVKSAKWYGKLSTVILYALMVTLVLFVNIPKAVVVTFSILSAAVLILAMILYVRYFLMALFGEKAGEKDFVGNVATSDSREYVNRVITKINDKKGDTEPGEDGSKERKKDK